MLLRSTCCQCVNRASSTGPKSPLSSRAWAGSSSCSWVPMIAPRRRTHGMRLVALVPDQAEPTAPLQRAGDLGQGPVEVEPVEGLGGHDGVEAVVTDGQLLGVRDRSC